MGLKTKHPVENVAFWTFVSNNSVSLKLIGKQRETIKDLFRHSFRAFMWC